jgi:hypothetical protein
MRAIQKLASPPAAAAVEAEAAQQKQKRIFGVFTSLHLDRKYLCRFKI